jgi:hypothetical protein
MFPVKKLSTHSQSFCSESMFLRHIYCVSANTVPENLTEPAAIKHNLLVNNYIYVAPSLHLVSEISGRLEKMGVTPRVITSDTHGKGVKKAIIEALKTGKKGSVRRSLKRAAGIVMDKSIQNEG